MAKSNAFSENELFYCEHLTLSRETMQDVDWAYMNSRVIVKPEDEWAKIVDEAELSDTLDEIKDSVDNE